MAWVKVPKEHHPLFVAALPKDKRVQTMQMFGGVAAKLNGNMFGGLFGRSIIVRLSDADREAALAIDGTAPFDPMGNGRVSKDTLMMAESVMEDPAEMKLWLQKAADHAATLPKKAAKAAKPAKPKKAPAKPAKKKR
jgi:TfoX/Sxy family transcriptional regulator of competence genes